METFPDPVKLVHLYDELAETKPGNTKNISFSYPKAFPLVITRIIFLNGA